MLLQSVSGYLLIGAALCLVPLVVYALIALVAAALAAARSLRSGEGVGETPSVPVDVFVPSQNEGIGLLKLVQSVLDQDYSGFLTVTILLENDTDSSLPHLRRAYNGLRADGRDSFVFPASPNRAVIIKLIGKRAKFEKLNAALADSSAPIVAFIDADHRAGPEWISTSVEQLAGDSVTAVQSRRAPIAVRSFAQLWDSAQNHLGNEALNRCLASFGASVFFTGTTCVFRRADLGALRFSSCVTEDTEFSLMLLLDGKRIIYNERSGSKEELAPDFRSYISRRRRWAAGHNSVFFGNLKTISRSELPFGLKLRLYLHGAFYLAPVCAALLVGVMAVHMGLQLTAPELVTAFGAALICSAAVCLFLLRMRVPNPAELLIGLAWSYPLVVLATPFVLKLNGDVLFYYLLMFPFQREVAPLQLFCLAAPFMCLVLANMRLRLFSALQIVRLLVSYPFIIFVDVYASLLGLFDVVRGRFRWGMVLRTFEDPASEAAIRSRNRQFLSGFGALLACVVIGALFVNEFGADDNCGEPTAPVFGEPLLSRSSGVHWRLEYEKQMAAGGTVEFVLRHRISGPDGESLLLNSKADDVPQPQRVLSTGSSVSEFRIERKAGFRPFHYQASLTAGKVSCSRTIADTTTVRTIRGREVLLNGEPFLLKGVIPSFSSAGTDLSLEQGYGQIKRLGANAIRIYHAPTDSIREQAEASGLLVIDQPDRSTWDDLDIGSSLQRRLLRNRLDSLYRSSSSFGYGLFHLAGNELELRRPNEGSENLAQFLEEVVLSGDYDMLSYSTYFVFRNYPVKLLGINMLDTGQTYWDAGLATAATFAKPVFASELGGFVAFYERPPPRLRAFRIHKDWAALEKHGFFGGIIFQSHDNWAQPVPVGFNDPLSAEAADDLRGIWDRANREKPELRIVEDIFSDLLVELAADGVNVSNRRAYRLTNVRIFDAEGKQVAGPFILEPGAKAPQTIPLNPVPVRATYSTHGGLAAESRFPSGLAVRDGEPVIVNRDFFKEDSPDATVIRGRVLYSNTLALHVPPQWSGISVNGIPQTLNPGVQSVPLPPTVQPLEAEIADADGTWRQLIPGPLPPGRYRLRVSLPSRPGADALLLLGGLGATKLSVRYGKTSVDRGCHPYREEIVPLRALSEEAKDFDAGSIIEVNFERDSITYIDPASDPTGRGVSILFEQPRLFDPPRIELKKDSLPER